MAKRIRIFFINCPSLAVDAASFLILAQNSVQTTLQFEVHHFWLYGRNSQGSLKGSWNKFLSKDEDRFHSNSSWLERQYRTKLDIRAAPFFSNTIPLKNEKWEPSVSAIVNSYDNWLKASGYSKYDFNESDPIIIITETPLFGKYLSFSTQKLAILGVADWREFMGSRSASALEYILTSVQRISLRLSYGAVVGSHYPTRGCLFDFHVHQPDVKISSFLGCLCEVCRQGLKRVATVEEYQEIETLIKNNWIGEEAKPDSIAGILKKDYKYSLRRSTGLRPSIMSSVTDSMTSEFGKFAFEILKWTITILVTLFLLTYFPNITDRWKNLLNGDAALQESLKTSSNTNVQSIPNENDGNLIPSNTQ